MNKEQIEQIALQYFPPKEEKNLPFMDMNVLIELNA